MYLIQEMLDNSWTDPPKHKQAQTSMIYFEEAIGNIYYARYSLTHRCTPWLMTPHGPHCQRSTLQAVWPVHRRYQCGLWILPPTKCPELRHSPFLTFVKISYMWDHTIKCTTNMHSDSAMKVTPLPSHYILTTTSLNHTSPSTATIPKWDASTSFMKSPTGPTVASKTDLLYCSTNSTLADASHSHNQQQSDDCLTACAGVIKEEGEVGKRKERKGWEEEGEMGRGRKGEQEEGKPM